MCRLRGDHRTLSQTPARRDRARPWGKRLERLARGGEAGSDLDGLFRREDRLHYVIDTPRWARGRSTGPAMAVRVFRQRRSHSGGWGPLRAILASEIRGEFVAHEAEDRDLCAVLRGAQPPLAAKEESLGFQLDRHLAGAILERIVQTGRGHLGDPESPPIAAGSPVPWRSCLRGVPSGSGLVLRPVFRRGDEELPWSEVPFVSPTGHLVHQGRLDRWCGNSHFPWFLSCLEEPFQVPKAELKSLVAALGSMADPPPVDLPGLCVSPEPPVPRLRLGRIEEQRRDLDVNVSFRYGDVELGLSDPQRTLPGTPGVLRDRGSELDQVSALVALGLRRGGGLDDRADGRLPKDGLGEAIEALGDAGWDIEVNSKELAAVSEFKLGVISRIDWFEIEGGLHFGGTMVDLPSVLQAARERQSMIALPDGRMGLISEGLRRRLLDLEAFAEEEGGTLRLPKARAWALEMMEGEASIHGDATWTSWRSRLETARSSPQASEPEGFQGTLRAYQKEGLGWLRFLRELGIGGLLADDMGLGKTVQILAFLQGLSSDAGKRTALVVVPRSLLFNWRREAQTFCPGLSVELHSGSDRARTLNALRGSDIVLTTYGLLRRDIKLLSRIDFDVIVLDEAQAIKNESSQTAKAARALKGRTRLVVSGTPVENRLGELWSLLEFLNPGMLGRSATFRRLLGERGDKALDAEGAALLRRALRPFILRRTKEEVAPELPARSEQVIRCDLDGVQLEHYERIRDHYRGVLLSKGSKELRSAGFSALEALLRLRQMACHPGLVDPELKGEVSCKLAYLIPQLEELRAQGHKALVFSQFTSFLDLVEVELDAVGIPHVRLDGKTHHREERVRLFQEDPNLAVFLISLKAGGVGLNLTAAHYVFLLDPWWNPATERQAIDRSHRIGQTHPVTAYRLVGRDTVEERILELQEQKKELASAVLGDSGESGGFALADLELLLS